MSIFDDDINILNGDIDILTELIISKESFINDSKFIFDLIERIFEDFTLKIGPNHDNYYMLINYKDDSTIYYISLYDGSKVIDIGFDVYIKFNNWEVNRWEIKINSHRDIYNDVNDLSCDIMYKHFKVFKIDEDFFNKIYINIKK